MSGVRGGWGRTVPIASAGHWTGGGGREGGKARWTEALTAPLKVQLRSSGPGAPPMHESIRYEKNWSSSVLVVTSSSRVWYVRTIPVRNSSRAGLMGIVVTFVVTLMTMGGLTTTCGTEVFTCRAFSSVASSWELRTRRRKAHAHRPQRGG